MRTPRMCRAALLVAVAATFATACGGGDDAAAPASTPAPVADPDPDATTAESAGGQVGAASFTIDGTTYEWGAVSCSGVRVIDGVTQPGAVVSSGVVELTTGAFMGFTMESADGAWSFDIADGGTGESWTVTDAVVSESGGTYEATGEAFSTSDSTPRPFQLSVTCP